MISDVKIVFKPGSMCPPNIPDDIWEQLDRSKCITIIPMNNLWEYMYKNINPDITMYKLYRDTCITDGVKQFMKFIIREKNTIESVSMSTITKWVEVI